MLRTALSLLAVGVVGSLTYACASSSDAAALGGDGGTSSDGRGPPLLADGGSPSPAANSELAPTAAGVILVHAAGIKSFRLCFENHPDLLPQPDATVMPEANVVGVDIGSAVRIPPMTAPGRVYLYEEALIRGLYPAFGAGGPSCKALTESSVVPIEIGNIDAPLTQGVHLLVVRGCPKATPFRSFTTRECGDDYVETVGNLAIDQKQLAPAVRSNPSQLPVQVVHLSQALESARLGKTISVRFGDITQDSAMTLVSNGPTLFGSPEPPSPVALDYSPDATAAYASMGFRVSLDDGAAEGIKQLDQSLADIQELSSPRAIPPSYFAQASNYVLLLLGDPTPPLADGGIDTDELRKLHFLAVPVVAPEADAGGADARAD